MGRYGKSFWLTLVGTMLLILRGMFLFTPQLATLEANVVRL
jgi:hypothetical protein